MTLRELLHQQEEKFISSPFRETGNDHLDNNLDFLYRFDQEFTAAERRENRGLRRSNAVTNPKSQRKKIINNSSGTSL